MPAYDFRCKTCENKFTVRISISERDKVRCPKCDSASVQQVFTPIAVQGVSGGSSCSSGDCGPCGGG